jgi:hypothetical protein
MIYWKELTDMMPAIETALSHGGSEIEVGLGPHETIGSDRHCVARRWLSMSRIGNGEHCGHCANRELGKHGWIPWFERPK